MRFEIIIIIVTGFLVYNAYHDGKYTKLLSSYKKYYQMVGFALLGLGLYIMLKRDPKKCKSLLVNANNFVKYMPFDKSTASMLNPVLDISRNGGMALGILGMEEDYDDSTTTAEQRILRPGKTTKRSVSETKKKFVASQQDWKCKGCQSKLNAWFEVDHSVSLESGGSNDVSNLVALCRECHGKKTAMSRM
jgi:hypothetical protein